MFLRRQVADSYQSALQTNPLRRQLDRCGASLASSGDTDLAYTALDIGLGMGLFARLRLQHIIPPDRLRQEYFLKLWEGMNYSHTLMRYVREGTRRRDGIHWTGRVGEVVRWLKTNQFDRKMALAARRGCKRADRLLIDLEESDR